VVLKKQRAGELSDSEAGEMLRDIMALPIRLMPHRPLVDVAYQQARQLNLTVYDALFLALAVERGAVLFTADGALAKAARTMRSTRQKKPSSRAWPAPTTTRGGGGRAPENTL
jgi:predicted nucleic acid-binding protein